MFSSACEPFWKMCLFKKESENRCSASLTVYVFARAQRELLGNRLCFLKLNLCRLLFSGVKHQSTSKQRLLSRLRNWVCRVCGSSTSVLPIDWKWATVCGWFDAASGCIRAELDSVSECKEKLYHKVKIRNFVELDRGSVMSRDLPQVIERTSSLCFVFFFLCVGEYSGRHVCLWVRWHCWERASVSHT